MWIESKKKTWRPTLWSDMIGHVLPSLRFDSEHEAAYKAHQELAAAAQEQVRARQARGPAVRQSRRTSRPRARDPRRARHRRASSSDDWAHRAITRDVSWGIPLPADLDPELAGKTLYVWPDSLIAPISFTQVALAARGEDPARYAEFWRDPEARIYQFLGQDNVFFYVLMQGAMWLGTQDDPHRLPVPRRAVSSPTSSAAST